MSWQGITLDQAKQWLRAHARDPDVRCPCCNRPARLYKRKLNAGMARSLIRMWRHAGTEYMRLTELGPMESRSREEQKLEYWGLAQEDMMRDIQGRKSGRWRVTEKGEAFLKEKITVPKYAYVFGGTAWGLDGDQIGIQDALGDKFDYQELLNDGRPDAKTDDG